MEQKTTTGQRFAPKKNIVLPVIVIFMNFSGVLVIQAFREYTTIGLTPLDVMDFVFIGIWALASGYFIWQWTGTYYELRNGQLFYRSGLTKGHIPVSSIRKIETHTRSWASTNAAIANKGMMITYNKWDEIFISPKDEAGFLNALLQINPEIQVKQPGGELVLK